MWTFEYIMSQIFVVIGMACLGATYLVKNKKTILIIALVSAFGYTMQYVFLHKYAGAAVNVIGMIRCIWFFFNDKKNKKNDYISISVISALIIIMGVVTFDGWESLLPSLAAILFTYSLWQSNVKVYRYIALVNSALWITYNTLCMSIMAIVSECILIVVEIIGVIRLYTGKPKAVSVSNENLQTNSVETVSGEMSEDSKVDK